MSPLHAQLTAAGAHFGSVNGWERPLWFAKDQEAHNWLDSVAREVAAATSEALIVDRSSDTKIALTGLGAREWLAARVTFPASTKESQARVAMFRGRSGRIEAMGRVLPWEDGWLLTVGPEQETRLKEWLRTARTPSGVHAADLTDALAVFEIHGPGTSSALPQIEATPDPIRDSMLLVKPSTDPLEESPKCVEDDAHRLLNNDHHGQR